MPTDDVDGPGTPPQEPYSFPADPYFATPEDMMADVLSQLEEEDVERLVRCDALAGCGG